MQICWEMPVFPPNYVGKTLTGIMMLFKTERGLLPDDVGLPDIGCSFKLSSTGQGYYLFDAYCASSVLSNVDSQICKSFHLLYFIPPYLQLFFTHAISFHNFVLLVIQLYANCISFKPCCFLLEKLITDERRAISPAKSRSSSNFVKSHLIPVFLSSLDHPITKLIARRKRNPDMQRTLFNPVIIDIYHCYFAFINDLALKSS